MNRSNILIKPDCIIRMDFRIESSISLSGLLKFPLTITTSLTISLPLTRAVRLTEPRLLLGQRYLERGDVRDQRLAHVPESSLNIAATTAVIAAAAAAIIVIIVDLHQPGRPRAELLHFGALLHVAQLIIDVTPGTVHTAV